MARRKSNGGSNYEAVEDNVARMKSDMESDGQTEGESDMAVEVENVAEETVEEVDLSAIQGTKAKINALAEAGHSRKEIAEILQVPYNTVQRHLRNRTDVATTSGSRGQEVEYNGETMPRSQAIRLMAEDGMSTSAIAKQLDIPYQYAYRVLSQSGHITKGEGSGTGGRARAMVTWEGEERPRLEVIRELAASGQSRGQIAKALNVPYQIVYQALKSQASAAGADEAEASDEDAEADDNE
jgi:hypothetical protein